MAAKKLVTLTTDIVDDCSLDSWPCACSECLEVHAAHQQLRNFTNPSALHPAFLGHWVANHTSMDVYPTAVMLPGDSPSLIKRLSPYCFRVTLRQHKWGNSIFVLLHSLNQVGRKVACIVFGTAPWKG